jgi:hypothetical protein
MQNESKIKCPNCGTEIDVQNVLAHQLEFDIKKNYETKLAEEKKKYEVEAKKLTEEKTAFEEKKKRENEIFQEKLDKRLKEEELKIHAALKVKIDVEKAEELKMLQSELKDKSDKVIEFNKNKAEIEKLKREKEELKETIQAEAEKTITETLSSARQEIRKQEQEKNQFALKELELKLEAQKKLTEEMRRKQNQGSMQIQGEVQELAIEEWLADNFPLDTIDEVKKGARGADCIQIVHTRNKQNCGTIYYESKRTKDFQSVWIEKFKGDIRDKGADIGVLVTEAMPADMERMGLKDGIWVCTFEEFKALCFVLRETIVSVSNAITSQENKGDKMHMLYDYLVSKTFTMQVEAIVEGFSQMKVDLDNEKRAMQTNWKKREKQIEKVITNTIEMYGSVKGIAGSAIPKVKALELTENYEPTIESKVYEF